MPKALISLLVACLLAGCATTQYNLPPIAAEGEGTRSPGKFIWHDLISDDPAGSAAFYLALFDWEFSRLPLIGADYWMIRHRGKPIGGMVSQASIPARRDISQWVSALSLEDPATAAASVRSAGGSVLREPVSLGERGTIAVFADAQGAIFAGLATTNGDPPDGESLPPVGAFLWHELWTSEPAAATAFYAEVGGLSVEEREGLAADGERIPFYVLRDDGVARAGVRPVPSADLPPLWLPYIRVAGPSRLATLLARVPEHGGSILVPATARPAGGFVAVVAGPSGAPIALQTWDE